MAAMSLFEEGSASRAEPRRLSLLQLTKELARSLAAVGRVAVEGEVVKPTRGGSGWTTFTLRDRACQINVYAPAARSRRCRIVAGERVRVTGRLEYRANRGDMQLAAEEVLPVGAGAIAALLAEARARLRAEGLLDRPARPWPALPRVIGVVCGGTAAVRADVESVVAARYPGYPVRFEEVTVTGPAAADAVCRGLETLDRADDVEVIILARGGGDAADLLPFSDEGLCRTIATSRTPVVSAIGHEGDRPLCDEVADHRFGTPSLAASAVVPDRAALLAELDANLTAAGGAVASCLSESTARIEALDLSAALASCLDAAAGRLESAAAAFARVDLQGRTDQLESRLATIDWAGKAAGRLERAEEVLRARRSALVALDPRRVLARGYAVVRSGGGKVVRDPTEVEGGDALDIELAGGRLGATVGTGAHLDPEGSKTR